jgi:hypothetical protein
LSEPSLAVLLLRPFRLEMLAASHAPVLAGLGARYGASWVRELVAGWSAQGSPWTQARERPAWIASLDALCAALAATGDAGPVLARLMLDNSWRWLADAVDSRHSLERPSSREQALSELAAPIAAVLIGAAAIGAADLREQVITSLRTAGDALLPCLIGVLRAVSDRQLGVDPLRRHCIQRLPRSPEDWSIDAPAGCGCPLCATLAGFLADPLRREFDWPLAQQGRRHVHERLDAHELPVRHQTRRVGRPYTLVLTKTPSLVEREAAARRQDETDLAWLREHLTQR